MCKYIYIIKPLNFISNFRSIKYRKLILIKKHTNYFSLTDDNNNNNNKEKEIKIFLNL